MPHAVEEHHKHLDANQIFTQHEEIERLHRVIAREVTEHDELGSEFVYVMVLKERVQKLEEALRWYAERNNYKATFDGEMGCNRPPEVETDYGQRARDVLDAESNP